MQRGEIFAAERMALDGDVVEARAALRIVTPRRPGRQEIESHAEAALDDAEAAHAAQRAGRSLPVRNTWRACPGPDAALW